ncbi:MIP/aquaporin family protein [Paenibacillus larvae]|uniref:Glycerol uptake facilitator protein GlpF n=2 Tax=Paenibacillus larvae TaxID=1464 RepID=A0A2L1TXS4_9BACL|nr:MIP/aquaporin family protein [Paenibacillus larvae]AQT86009.1 aquaporin [Paenibacillus larvae subsp. pulvifaciens]AQZ45746.1 aquaporin [Paenibacillus larvae subsp. pulvifaciens]AVF25476.1 glycerol uptake facilitator protein GlpF [Paenibacillus larvae subsp. larvae]AVF30253.1 glycerol uptake facilitator protein GlpF [Paenibacillus larvae subsp. larvae]MBH0342942.1 glycerol transporter [Paenibacillus larvae]
MSSFMGELVGTMILIILGGGVCAGVNLKKSFAHQSGWIVITFGWGLAVAMGAYAVGSVSGAHLNPALTLALAFKGDFAWTNVPAYILAQMIGAFLGAVIVFLHYLPHWKETEDPGAKLGVFSTGPAIPNPFANLLSEMIGTFILVLGILAIGANKFTDGLNPFIVGFLIVSIGLSLGGTTGYAINPARDLGPRIAHFLLPIPGKGSSNWKYAWIPVVGPILGGCFGGLFYKAVFEGKQTAALWGIVAAILVVLALAAALRPGVNSTKSTLRS